MKTTIVFSCFFAVLILISLIEFSSSNICDMCLCSETDGNIKFNCHGRQIGNTFKLSLLTSNYEKISYLNLSENDLTSLPLYMFEESKIQKNLKILDLSHNLLTEMEEDVLNTLSNLQILNLSHNKLLSPLKGIKIPSLQRLDLHYNIIDTLKTLIEGPHTNLIYLDLSHNYLTTLLNGSFNSAPNLRVLNLSFNKIDSLNTDNFLNITNLRTLKIDHNSIKTISDLVFPASLIELDLSFNLLETSPENLREIKILNVEYNQISVLDDKLVKFRQLENLNISGNTLETFPNIQMKNLKNLDISNNNLLYIPESLNLINFPSLKILVISGNPLKELKFADLQLESLIIQNISEFESIGADSFTNLRSNSGECLNLTISNNNKLNYVNEKAFSEINVCYVDLSNNKLEYVSPNIIVANGLKLKYGIDLQGNPFSCNCSLQWILNDLVPWLYSINPELLDNLRCAKPEELKLKRMVHWYKWPERVFCSKYSQSFSRMSFEAASVLADGRTITLHTSDGMIIVLIVTGTLLLILVVIGIIIARKISLKRNRRNRRL